MGGLSTIFRAVVIMSCAGGVLTLALTALRPLSSRLLGHTRQYYIYIAALIIMLVPVSFGRPYSPYPESIEIPEQTQTDVSDAPQAAENTDTADTDADGIDAPAVENGARIFTVTILGLLKYIWIAGAIIFLLGAAVSYARFARLLNKDAHIAECELFEEIKSQMGIKRNIVIKRSAVIDAPLMLGIMRPMLVLPERELNKTELRCVLLHELTHYKRRDLLYKLLALIVNAVHWFNPLAYLLVRRINEDCEISCDVTVTRRMTGKEKKAYMRTIVSLMEGK